MSKCTKEEVEIFLNDFHAKLTVFNVFFISRKKNAEALSKLEIDSLQRLEYIKSIKPENYFNGPNDDAYDPQSPPNWEFGMNIKRHEVYIKINLGKTNKSVMCISFHIAEKEINYPFH
ncbi:MAG: toxin [Ignavibacteria bacterium]|nr:toxin [Ignavibacteria bacterium]